MSFLSQASRRMVTRPVVSFYGIRMNATNATPGAGLTTTRQDHEKSGIVEPTEAPKHVVTADVVSGAPTELRHRAVRIYKPTRNTMQVQHLTPGSILSDTNRVLDVERGRQVGTMAHRLGHLARIWPMGKPPDGMGKLVDLTTWWHSADYMQGTRMNFRTKEDAVHFAEKQGWDYYVQPETVKRIPPKNYAGNYTHIPHTLRIHHTK
ncbi:hypothetical protein FRC10_001925 [Ceratobasidium sp. 414]|nr:hypothetical protein FRC10_001925 [Ceratobasidium sp. 414]